jgi:hypothetical protein
MENRSESWVLAAVHQDEYSCPLGVCRKAPSGVHQRPVGCAEKYGEHREMLLLRMLKVGTH